MHSHLTTAYGKIGMKYCKHLHLAGKACLQDLAGGPILDQVSHEHTRWTMWVCEHGNAAPAIKTLLRHFGNHSTCGVKATIDATAHIPVCSAAPEGLQSCRMHRHSEADGQACPAHRTSQDPQHPHLLARHPRSRGILQRPCEL